MPLLMLKDLPRYECLLECANRYPEMDPVAASVFMHLLRTADELFEVKADFMRRHNISNGRFTVLMLLSSGDPADDPGAEVSPRSPADLAEMAGVTRATMTGLIDTLEKDGLVRRETDQSDRRAMLVHLTDAGLKFLQDMLPGYFQRVTAIMAPLGVTEKKKLLQLLTKVRVGIEDASQVEADESISA
jgi:DNA-binding MarR family transcriptional regulator